VVSCLSSRIVWRMRNWQKHEIITDPDLWEACQPKRHQAMSHVTGPIHKFTRAPAPIYRIGSEAIGFYCHWYLKAYGREACSESS
jgi:hypothetical protein